MTERIQSDEPVHFENLTGPVHIEAPAVIVTGAISGGSGPVEITSPSSSETSAERYVVPVPERRNLGGAAVNHARLESLTGDSGVYITGGNVHVGGGVYPGDAHTPTDSYVSAPTPPETVAGEAPSEIIPAERVPRADTQTTSQNQSDDQKSVRRAAEKRSDETFLRMRALMTRGR